MSTVINIDTESPAEVARAALAGNAGAIATLRAQRSAEHPTRLSSELPPPPGQVGEILAKHSERLAAIRADTDTKDEVVTQRVSDERADTFRAVETELGNLHAAHEQATAKDIAKIRRQARHEPKPARDYETATEKQARIETHRSERAEVARAATEASTIAAVLLNTEDPAAILDELQDVRLEAEESPATARQFGRLGTLAVNRLKTLERAAPEKLREATTKARIDAEGIQRSWGDTHPSLRQQVEHVEGQAALNWGAVEQATRFALNANGWRIEGHGRRTAYTDAAPTPRRPQTK